jgi:hypothetical protein
MSAPERSRRFEVADPWPDFQITPGLKASVKRCMTARRPEQAPLTSREDVAIYLREITPAADTAPGPCPTCGDRAWFKLDLIDPWSCRTCELRACLERGWRWYPCRHDPPCSTRKHVRSSIARWFIAPEGRP